MGGQRPVERDAAVVVRRWNGGQRKTGGEVLHLHNHRIGVNTAIAIQGFNRKIVGIIA